MKVVVVVVVIGELSMKFPRLYKKFYLHCKNLGITPSHIFSWIKDLLDFYSKSISNTDTSASLIERDNAFDKKPIIMNSFLSFV